MIVYAVRYSNYEPPEVDSLWVFKRLAKLRASELHDKDPGGLEWDVTPMTAYANMDTFKKVLAADESLGMRPSSGEEE